MTFHKAFNLRSALLSSFTLLAATASSGSLAQPASRDQIQSQSPALEEVVVTAQKREQRLQDI
ncbi:MAG: hypothetical protein RLP45_06985, partial [Haliea sp.]